MEEISEERYREIWDEHMSLSVVMEPLHLSTATAEIDRMFELIDSADTLTADDKEVARYALFALLDGCIPSRSWLMRLEKAVGSDFICNALDKKAKSVAEISSGWWPTRRAR